MYLTSPTRAFLRIKNCMANKIVSYLKETKEELVRVAWPSREVVIKHTLLVVLVSVLVSLYLGAADLLFAYGLEKLINN